jgi:hypothetical protein
MTTTALTIWAQGQGSVYGPWLNRAVQNVDNVAALRAQPGIDGMTALIQGTVVQNDGGQGTFSWNSTSTIPDDNGVTSIMPPGYTMGGRWLRQPAAVGSIGANSVTNALLAQAPAGTLKGNLTGSLANVVDNTIAAVTAALGYASTVLQGVVTLATPAQAVAGTSTSLAVTPAGLAAALAASGSGWSSGGSAAITLPGATDLVGTVGSSGWAKDPAGNIKQWAYVQFKDVNAQTATTWTFPIAFPNNVTRYYCTNMCAMADQGANANRGVLSVASSSLTAASFILRDTAATNTLGVWMVEADGN